MFGNRHAGYFSVKRNPDNCPCQLWQDILLSNYKRRATSRPSSQILIPDLSHYSTHKAYTRSNSQQMQTAGYEFIPRQWYTAETGWWAHTQQPHGCAWGNTQTSEHTLPLNLWLHRPQCKWQQSYSDPFKASVCYEHQFFFKFWSNIFSHQLLVTNDWDAITSFSGTWPIVGPTCSNFGISSHPQKHPS